MPDKTSSPTASITSAVRPSSARRSPTTPATRDDRGEELRRTDDDEGRRRASAGPDARATARRPARTRAQHHLDQEPPVAPFGLEVVVDETQHEHRHGGGSDEERGSGDGEPRHEAVAPRQPHAQSPPGRTRCARGRCPDVCPSRRRDAGQWTPGRRADKHWPRPDRTGRQKGDIRETISVTSLVFAALVVGVVAASQGPAPWARASASNTAGCSIGVCSVDHGPPGLAADRRVLQPAEPHGRGQQHGSGQWAGRRLPRQPARAGLQRDGPRRHGHWWTLADNGYGARQNSADWQLAIYRIDPRLRHAGGPAVLSTVVLSDPRGTCRGRSSATRPAPTCRLSTSTSCPARRRRRAAATQRPASSPGSTSTPSRSGRIRRHVLARRRVRAVPAPRRPHGQPAGPPSPRSGSSRRRTRRWTCSAARAGRGARAAASRAWRSAPTAGRCTRCSRAPVGDDIRRTSACSRSTSRSSASG